MNKEHKSELVHLYLQEQIQSKRIIALERELNLIRSSTQPSSAKIYIGLKYVGFINLLSRLTLFVERVWRFFKRVGRFLRRIMPSTIKSFCKNVYQLIRINFYFLSARYREKIILELENEAYVLEVMQNKSESRIKALNKLFNQ